MSIPDRLDSLLRGWADRHEASNQNLDVLTRLICERLDSSPEQLAMVAGPRPSSRRVLVWTAASGVTAASIALLIFIAVRSVDFSDSSLAIKPSVKQTLNSDILLGFAPLDIAEKKLVAREMQTLFPGRFAWFMESGSETELGLNTDDTTRPAPVIAIRFVIESKRGGDGNWKILQRLDFVTVSEETVIASPGGDADVSFWAYATPDGMISVDADLDLTGLVQVRVSSSRLTAAGSPAEIWQAERDGVKYRIHQIAEIIDDNRIG